MKGCHAVVPHAEVKQFCLSAGTEPGWYVCELVNRCPTAVKKQGKYLSSTAGVSSWTYLTRSSLVEFWDNWDKNNTFLMIIYFKR